MALIVVLVNKSALAEVSDYDYEVLVGDGSPGGSQTIERGHVVGHRRSDRWPALIIQMLRQRGMGVADKTSDHGL